MGLHQIRFAPDFAGWQKAARQALMAGWCWDSVAWEEADGSQPSLALGDEEAADDPEPRPEQRPKVPRAFVEMAAQVACHRSPERWGLLYRLLWRLTHGEGHLLKVAVDPDVHSLMKMQKAVRHDVHKMRAFVRFREVVHEGRISYVAWFEPQHFIVEYNARFFVDRFAGMQWSILTPDRCVHWEGKRLTFTPGVSRSTAPREDAVEALWLEYYAHIFNPARVKTGAMLSEMPLKYWKNLPEASIIPKLLHEATPRVEAMMARSSRLQEPPAEAAPMRIPETDDLEVLRDAAASCRACSLYAQATQTVFGEGPVDAEIVFLGEQPGDQEDQAGRPFVGPAGALLDRALQAAGIDRGRSYVTNAVKHFKWQRQGKRRLHQTPVQKEIRACRPWWQAELRLIKPRVLVCLGSTAAQTVMDHPVKINEVRGVLMETLWANQTLITVHPSSLLRQPDPETRAREYDRFVADLALAARALKH
jgi:DNA polymerase